MVLHAIPTFAPDAIYLDTYDDCREAFRRLARRVSRAHPGGRVGAVAIPSETDSDLTLDYLYLPAREKKEGLVILSSGVHGAEGFVGSAMQRMLLVGPFADSLLPTATTGYLFLHGINAYGFRHKRRVTENNVDLNRNFATKPRLFETENPAYRAMRGLLMPEGPASSHWLSHSWFVADALFKAAWYSRPATRQAVVGGQYELERGVYFGGFGPEPHQEIVRDLVMPHAEPYSKVLTLDFHTGFGRRAFMHLFPNIREEETIRRFNTVFGNYPIELDDKEFYTNEGEFSIFLHQQLQKAGKISVPMLVEYGTLDSQTTAGSLASLSRVVLENQKHWYGARSPAQAREIDRLFLELFYPTDPTWRRRVTEQTRAHLPRFIRRFEALLSAATCDEHLAVEG